MDSLYLDSSPSVGRFVRSKNKISFGDIILQESSIVKIPDFSSTLEKQVEREEWFFNREEKEESKLEESKLEESKLEENKLVVDISELTILSELKELELLCATKLVSYKFLSISLYLVLQSTDTIEKLLKLHLPDINSSRIILLKENIKICLPESILSSIILKLLNNNILNSDYISKLNSYESQIDLIIKLTSIMECNCYQGYNENTSEIYQYLSLFNHSCNPNAHQYSVSSGKKVLRALRNIDINEEITVTYLYSKDLLLPTEFRNRKIIQERQFICNCKTCTGLDYNRSFQCPKCNNYNVVVGPDELMICTNDKCKHLLKYNQKANILTQESSFVKKLQILDSIILKCDNPDDQVLSVIEKAHLIGYSHHAMRECYSILCDFYFQRNNEKHLFWSKKQVKSLFSILLKDLNFGLEDGLQLKSILRKYTVEFDDRILNFEAAVLLDRLGDATDDKEESSLCYQMAYFIMSTLHGKDHKYSIDLYPKLINN